jgi:hypothetical protein
MEILATIVLIVVVIGFAMFVFSRVAGDFLHRTGERGRDSTADEWYPRFDDSRRRRRG